MQVQERREKPNIKASGKRLTKVSRHPCASKSIFLLALMSLQLAAQQYVVNTVAGGGPGPEPATNAGLNIGGLAIDQAGDVYFSQYSRVFKVDTSGKLSIVAGKWMTFNDYSQTSSGDGGPATQAVIISARAVTVDTSGNLFFVDWGSVRKVAAGTGTITTVYPAGGGSPNDLAVDAHGNLYVAGTGIGVDVVAPNGTISHLAGSDLSTGIGAVGVDNTGAVYVGTYDGLGNMWTYRVINGQSSLYSAGHSIVRFDSNGNGYAPDLNTNQILRYAPGGQSFTVVTGNGQVGFSGDGGTATAAELNHPGSVAVQPNGTFILFDRNSRIREVSNGIINTIAGTGWSDYGGDNYSGGIAQLVGIEPHYIALDATGNIYLRDQYRIRKVDAQTGIVTTVAGNGSFDISSPDGTPALQASIGPSGIAVDSSGTIYFIQVGLLRKVFGGILSTVMAIGPGDGLMTVDGAGNLYIATGSKTVVRVAASNHALTTLAGSGSSNPIGGVSALTVDHAGTFVYFVDTAGGVLKKVPAGGGAASVIASGFNSAYGLAIDLDGSLLVSDNANSVIQRVSTNGGSTTITTIAGTGTPGFNGDGLVAVATQFYGPWGVAVDSQGRILVDDYVNSRVRSLTPATAVTVTTNPSGLNTLVDGVSAVAPQAYGWVPGSTHTIAVSPAQLVGNTSYTFTGWSDGGALSHSVTATASAVTYTAVFNATVCTFGLGSSSTSVSSAGANSSVNVTASPSNCPWTAMSNVPWITTSATGTGDGTAGFTVAANAGAARSGTLTVAGQLFTVNQAGGAAAAVIALSLAKLQFGYSGQLITGTQTVALNFSPSAAISWTASSNQSNITVSPTSGTGNAILQITAAPGASGLITVTAGVAANSPQQIQVNVVTVTPGQPFGSFDTPVNNTTGVAGAIPVTGWALDSIQATNVGIWREPVVRETAQSNGLVFIGNAVFVAGARPDVQATYPNSPFNYRAGWGYMLLTNFLPNASGSGPSGNGTYKLHAIITNASGQNFDLGARAITVDNVHAAKPFGTIDTPAQGGTVSGNAYVNFGWALTQNSFAIPTDGSTITVILDGVPVGHPAYNQYRSDIANLFPGLANSNGAIGFFYIDTTTLANGVHTISWNAFDNAGRGDGLGSRYFSVVNANGGVAAPEEPPPPESLAGRVRLRSGHDLNAPQMALDPDASGSYSIEMEQLGRIELSLGASSGYLIVGGQAENLPLGSSLKAGVFYWQAPLAFLGKYELLFERLDGTQIPVRVNIVAKRYSLQ